VSDLMATDKKKLPGAALGRPMKSSLNIIGDPHDARRPHGQKKTDSVVMLNVLEVSTYLWTGEAWANLGSQKGFALNQLPATSATPLYVTEISEYESEHDALQATALPHLECGGHVYPLHQPLSENVFRQMAERLVPGQEPTVDLVERALHARFQRLLGTPPHEMTPEDKDEWNFIVQIVDFEQYRALNPVPLPLVGSLVSRDLRSVTLGWQGGTQEVFDFREVPAEILKCEIGATVEVQLRRHHDSRPEFLTCRVSPSLRDDSDVWRDAANAVPSLDDLPLGRWPKRSN